jgi:signal transduction histidine kinase
VNLHPGIHVTLNSTLTIVSASAGADELFKATERHPLAGTRISERFFTDHKSQALSILQSVAEAPAGSSSLLSTTPPHPGADINALQCLDMKGNPLFLQWSCVNIGIADSRDAVLHCTITDLTHIQHILNQTRTRESLYRDLLTKSADGIVFVDQNGAVETGMFDFRNDLDLDIAQLSGRGFPDPNWHMVDQNYNQLYTIEELIAKSTDRENPEPVGIYHRDSYEFRWFQVSRVTRDAVNLYLVFRDISPLMKISEDLRREKDQLYTLASLISEGLWIGNADSGEGLYSNPAFSEITGIPMAGHRNLWIEYLLGCVEPGHPIISELIQLEHGRILQQSRYDQVPIIDHNRQPRWLRFTLMQARVSMPGSQRLMVVFLTDITIQKQREQEAETTRKTLESTNQLKNTVLSSLSHEFRTPLTAIMGFSALVRDIVDADIARDFIIPIQESADRLFETLSDIVDYAVLESDSMGLHPDTLIPAEILSKTLQSASQQCGENKLDFYSWIGIEEQIFSDRRALVSITSRLLSNAVKFTTNGYVAFYMDADSEHLHMYVMDSGIGITDDTYDMIFEPFRQGSEGLSRAREGLGLGLPIVRKTLCLLNGELHQSGNTPNGTIFHISIPHIPHYLTHFQENTMTELANTKRILFVEDNDLLHGLLRLILRKYDITCCTTAEKALEILDYETFDLFIVDINLGHGMNGITFCKHLRSRDEYSEIPVIALTAISYNDMLEHIGPHGFNDYLGKPFRPEQVTSMVTFFCPPG